MRNKRLGLLAIPVVLLLAGCTVDGSQKVTGDFGIYCNILHGHSYSYPTLAYGVQTTCKDAQGNPFPIQIHSYVTIDDSGGANSQNAYSDTAVGSVSAVPGTTWTMAWTVELRDSVVWHKPLPYGCVYHGVVNSVGENPWVFCSMQATIHASG